MTSNNIQVLVIGDEHFQTSNIPEVELFIEKIEKLAMEKKPDFIVSLGDLLHTHERLNTIPLNKAHEFINKLRKIAPVYSLIGNHDMLNNQEYLNTNHWQNSMKEWENVVIVDKVISVIINNYKFVFSPYVYTGRFQEALNTIGEDWKDASCIFAHQEFYGCKMGAIISIEGDKWSLDNPHIISGHIHSRQIIQPNIYYTGSAMQHAFGESEKNIVACITFNKESKDYIKEEIDLNLPRKRIIRKTVEDMESYIIPETEDKLKITLSGVYEEFKAFKKTTKYKDIIESGIKIVFKPKKIDIKEEENIEKEDISFSSILDGIISKEKNICLSETYDYVVNKK